MRKNLFVTILFMVLGFSIIVTAQVIGDTQVIDLSEKARDFFIEATKGNVIGQETLSKFGHNLAVGTSLEDIQGEGGTLTFLTSANIITIVSDSASDTIAGAGARSVEVLGLDSNFDEISEIVNLSGATAVNTTLSFLRVYRMKVNSVGGYGGVNVGVITGTAFVNNSVQISILVGEGQSQTTHYTVPRGKEVIVTKFSISIETGRTTKVQFVVRENADDVVTPFSPTKVVKMWHGVAAPLVQENKGDFKFTEMTDIWMRGLTTTGATSEIEASYDIVQYAIGS